MSVIDVKRGTVRTAGFRAFDDRAARVEGLPLSAAAFPNAAELRKDAELGRLTVAADSPQDASGAYRELYAFVGLERVSGVVVHDVTDPRRPALVDHLNTRDFAGSVADGTAGDVGPEGVFFVPAGDSPTRRPLLIVGNEVSGTTAIHELR
ncbi:choice-of-anchor I domain-containing protein [Nonomuraea sp. NPDC050153]|uniref:choice-of-anchor I domain-containing protein n=1 Tax=Nonomuraea sp. NPDC050153 TaxID=3364359 RepID=UPI0037AD4C8C